jgi:DNA repair exonuclease SbcCD nuclease subunit
VRIGLISDTHFQNWQAFGQCHENRISKRLLKQKDNFLQAIDFFQKEKVDFIVHGGDWVHTVGSVSNEVLNISNDLLDGLSIPIVFDCGNHDTPVRVSPKKHHLLTNILNKLRVYKPSEEKLSRIFIINYQDEVDYDKVKGYDLVVVHKTPVGSILGNFTFEDGVNWRKLAAQNKFVAFGHIHQMQKLSANCFVIGSPMQLGFGDEGRRGVWIVDTGKPAILPDVDPGEEGSLKFHKLDYPEFITVDSPDKIKDDGNYYKLFGTSSKLDNDNVISVVVPEVFTERIKSQDFHGILQEWLTINDKDDSYLDLIKDILEEKLSLVKDIYKGRLAKVKINDFLSVGDVEYKIPENGFTLVSGDSDSFSSNGSGKSTIIGESICWCLTGETTKGLTGDDVVRRGRKDARVTLDFSPELTITRSVSNGLEVYQKVGSERKDLVEGLRKPERQDQLEKYILGFGKELILASIYFSQENVVMLTKMSDTKKTNMVTDLLGFEQYDELYDKVDLKIKKFEEDILSRDKDKIGFEKELAVKQSELGYLDKNVEDKKRQIADFGQSIQSYEEQIADLEGQVTADNIMKKVDYDSQIDELNARQELLASKIEATREIKDGVQEEYHQLYSKVTTLRIELDTSNTDRRKVEREIDSLKSVKTDVRCDKCYGIVTEDNIDLFRHDKNAELSKIDADLKITESELNTQERALDDIRKQLDKLTEKEKSFTSEQSKIRPQLLSLHDLKDRQDEVERSLQVRNEVIRGKIDKFNSFIKDYSDRSVLFEEDLAKLKKDRISLSNDAKLVESYISDADALIGKCKVNIEKMGFWKIAFSPKGIRSVLLDRFCNDINSKINEYLSTISGGTMSIMVTPTKTIKSGEERNEIGMSIQLNGNEAKYESLSGGEKRRVDVSLCFGLNKFVSDRYSVPNGILGLVILDEIFSFLDKSGEESVAELLHNEGKSRSIFVIDHALNLSDYADRTWIVHKDKEISSLEMVKQ